MSNFRKIASFFAIYLITITRLNGLNKCDNGWINSFNRCWYLSDSYETWDSSKNACRSMGGFLASIQNSEENDFVHSLLIQSERFQRTKRQAFTNDLDPGFEVRRNAVLLGYGERSIRTSNPRECQRECARSSLVYRFTCLSVLYYPEEPFSSNCILNSESRSTHPENFLTVAEDRVDYYGRLNLLNPPVRGPQVFQPPSLPQPDPLSSPDPRVNQGQFPTLVSNEYPGNCFTGNRDTFLVGHAVSDERHGSLGDCQNSCLQFMRVQCKSLMYYPDTGQCILNSETGSNDPMLLSKSLLEKVDYYEMTVECQARSRRRAGGSGPQPFPLQERPGPIFGPPPAVPSQPLFQTPPPFWAPETPQSQLQFGGQLRIIDGAWLGLTNSSIVWEDGTPLIYRNYDFTMDSREVCIAFETKQQKWISARCNQKMIYICSKPMARI